jgi:adenylate cyclase
MPPPQVIEVLNRYLGVMSELVDAHSGCVIEFLGDGILAVFGAPNYLPQHEEATVRCALTMQERIADLNRHWQRSGVARYWRGHPGQAVGQLSTVSRLQVR